MEIIQGKDGAAHMEYRYYKDASGLVHDADCYCVKNRVSRGTGMEDFEESDMLHAPCARRCLIKKGMWSELTDYGKYELWFNECGVPTGLINLLVLKRHGHFRLHGRKMFFFVGTDAWCVKSNDSDKSKGVLFHRDYRIHRGKVHAIHSYHRQVNEKDEGERSINDLILWISCHSIRVDDRGDFGGRSGKKKSPGKGGKKKR